MFWDIVVIVFLLAAVILYAVVAAKTK